ncbi:hypothetical protein OS493_000048 [Desmophyllum pertusum]|uniref:Uncharacterized protein n=1 Tax=Desmophyllum pertusum TaxID=174260 RepID=A0A9X0A6C9_9CNID|nr:hypothetical protein OS493_000048 [Desmophyllum pertusum]
MKIESLYTVIRVIKSEIKNLEEDEEFQQALKTSHGQRPGVGNFVFPGDQGILLQTGGLLIGLGDLQKTGVKTSTSAGV